MKGAQAGGGLGRSGLGEAEGPPAPQDLSRSRRSGDKGLAMPVGDPALSRCRRQRASACRGQGWPCRRETATRGWQCQSTLLRPPAAGSSGHQPAGARDGPAGVKQRQGAGSASWQPCTHPLQEAAGHQPAGARDGPAGVKQPGPAGVKQPGPAGVKQPGPAGVKRRGRDSNPWTSF